MDTEELIETLAAKGRRVRPARAVSRCLLVWLAVALPGSAIVALMMGLRPDISEKLADPRFLIQEAAALATAVTAAMAALCASIPGTPRWKLAVPLLPLGVWISALGRQCWSEWLVVGWSGMEYRPDAMCIPAIILTGLVPAVSLLLLIRKGAPLSPPIALTLAALAAAALGDVFLRLFHQTDAALMLLVWQLGTVLALTGLGALAGRHPGLSLRGHS